MSLTFLDTQTLIGQETKQPESQHLVILLSLKAIWSLGEARSKRLWRDQVQKPNLEEWLMEYVSYYGLEIF